MKLGNTHSGTQWAMAFALAAALAAGAAFMVSCESSSSGGASGTSTISGNVATYSAGGAFYMPSQPAHGLARLLADAGDFFVPRALAAVPGVHVSIAGTDHAATTEDDGSFTISGVPGGDQHLEFAYAGSVASTTVNIPDDSTVTLGDVRVSGPDVMIGHMSVEHHAAAPPSPAPMENKNPNETSNMATNAMMGANEAPGPTTVATNTAQSTATNQTGGGSSSSSTSSNSVMATSIP